MPTRLLHSRRWLLKCALLLLPLLGDAITCNSADHSDRLLDLFIKKGMLTQEEVNSVLAEDQAMATNRAVESKWKIFNAIKNVELFGDIRLRYEHRQANTPADSRIELDRGRVAVRLGLRGEAFDSFYYGL